MPDFTISCQGPRDEYLVWLKARVMRLEKKRHLNLALSGISVEDGWLANTLSRHGEEIASFLGAKSEYGLEPLKAAIADKFGIASPHEILLTMGASGGIARTYQSLLTNYPGAEIALETPTYGPLAEIPRRLGAHLVRFDRSDVVNSLEKALNERTLAIVLSNPNNPTSHFLTKEDQWSILDIVERRAPRAIIVLDHTFAGLVDPAELILQNHPRAVCISSLSKCFGAKLNLLRIGWITAAPDTFPDLFADAILFENSGCKVSEICGLLSFENIGFLRASAKTHLDTNLKVARKRLEAMHEEGLLDAMPIHFGSVLFARMTGVVDSYATVMDFLERKKLLLAPGRYFEGPQSNGIRIGIGGGTDELDAGLTTLQEALREMS